MDNTLPDVSVRRATVDDIPAVREIMGDEEFIYTKRYGEDLNLSTVIETHFLSVTALDDADNVVGFASFTHSPMPAAGIKGGAWPDFLKSAAFEQDNKTLQELHPCNTLWVTFMASARQDDNGDGGSFEVTEKLLSTALATCPHVHNLLFALPDSAPPFSPLTELFPLKLPGSGSIPIEKQAAWGTFSGAVYHAHRTDIIPPLIIRTGVVEDYDDLIPLLLSGEGVVTPLPENLYLEELLQDQDEYHSVLVAEDPVTHKVIGLMCLGALFEEQQYVTKQYALDHFNKLKPQFTQTHKGQQAAHNTFRITFFYLNPNYDSRAQQFLPHAFDVFPFAEYCFVYLPHASPEHALLHHFAYVPIRKFQPSNMQGEKIPLPEGMWLSCRYAHEDVTVRPIVREQEENVARMLRSQSEVNQDAAETMCLALSQAVPMTTDKKDEAPSDLPFAAYIMTWRDQPVGVAIIRHLSVEEVYSLRENFDLDTHINFTPHGDRHLGQSDISLDPHMAKTSFYRNDVPSVVVKHLYVKPVFRGRLRLLLREALRLSNALTVVHVAGTTGDTYSPLLNELIHVPPRRMIDQVKRSGAAGDGTGDGADATEGNTAGDISTKEDVDALVCLYHSTVKLLSDEKTKIHARIVVIGSSTTGLAFIYSLLTIPYLQFTNIVLVSVDGLPEHPNHREHMWTVDTMDWLEREYILMKIGKRIKVIEGTMMDFDKVDKYIFTDGGQSEPYDHLIIAAGRQYTIPKTLVSDHGAKNGVFALSNSTQISKIKQHIHESEIYEDDMSSAVIYGSSLDVYSVATSIVDLGLAPQRLVVVSPSPSTYSPFGDPLVDLKIEKLCETLGIRVYKGHALERLEYDEDSNLSTVVLAPMEGNGNAVELNATMFIYAHEKDIDTHVLYSLNERSIVFDGRVIIELNYRTTDRHIYAAGPVAMFSRRFGPSPDFEVYSAMDVGHHLCEALLGFLGVDEFYDTGMHEDKDKNLGPKDDPLAAQLGYVKADEGKGQRRRPEPVPTYTGNVCRRLVLPSNYLFFTCYSMRYESVAEQCTHVVSSSHDGDDYVRICVGPNKYIESVTYFGTQSTELYNLRSLVGLPESALNLLYTHAEVNANNRSGDAGAFNVLSYIRQPWAHAVFYDRFLKLFKDMQAQLKEHPDVVRVKQDAFQSLLKDRADTVPDEERDRYCRRLTHDHSDARHHVELELTKFLHDNKAFLPQYYFLPDVTPHVHQPR